MTVNLPQIIADTTEKVRIIVAAIRFNARDLTIDAAEREKRDRLLDEAVGGAVDLLAQAVAADVMQSTQRILETWDARISEREARLDALIGETGGDVPRRVLQ